MEASGISGLRRRALGVAPYGSEGLGGARETVPGELQSTSKSSGGRSGELWGRRKALGSSR
eukprot:10239991-Alexandrium_andersonii.AAC.1